MGTAGVMIGAPGAIGGGKETPEVEAPASERGAWSEEPSPC
jgi:hypothetical protein